jgi:hypothetical protein
MESQSDNFFGKAQLHVAHSIVTDVAAYGLGKTLEDKYEGKYTISRTKCMMHQMGKLCQFGMCQYKYRDGRGGDAFPCPALAEFNSDFQAFETMYRMKGNVRQQFQQDQGRWQYAPAHDCLAAEENDWVLRVGESCPCVP